MASGSSKISHPEGVSRTSVCAPAAVKVTSTWLVRSSSCPGCQVNATTPGGSHRVTVPHSACRPPADRSMICPSANVTVPSQYTPLPAVSGHHRPSPAVKISNAASGTASTSTSRRIGGDSLTTGPPPPPPPPDRQPLGELPHGGGPVVQQLQDAPAHRLTQCVEHGFRRLVTHRQ